MRGRFFAVLLVLLMPMAAGAETLPASRAQIAMSFSPLVKQTAPAVVNIYTRKLVRQRLFAPFMDDPVFQRFFGLPPGLTRERMENSLGSGVIVRDDGLVVTSAHVIQEADEIRVVLADRREFSARTLTSDKKTDLAVLRIDDVQEKLPTLELADSDAAEVGDLVVAIGNPFGVGQTVTSGIVSGLARTGVEINALNYFIQTDAAINPGNSGGALVGMDGKLLGVNAAIYSQSGGNMGIGFAVPANMVRAVVEAVENGGGRVVRPWLGIHGQDVTPELARSMGLARPLGVVVNRLNKESPLARAGLKIGDVVQALNGRAIEDMAALRFRAAMLPVGSKAVATVFRQGKAQEVEFALVAPPEIPARQDTVLKGRHVLAGVKVANLSPAVAEELGVADTLRGVVVLSAQPGGPFGLELMPGDIVVSINKTAVESVDELVEALRQPLRRWMLQIRRDGRLLNFMIGG